METLYYFETWKSLDNTHPLLLFIKLCSEYILSNIRILISVNGRCARAEYPSFTFTGGSRRWIATFCRNYTSPTDVFICEKPRMVNTMMCNADYYQCEDATCILELYVCDSVNDCLNGEDETKCDTHVLKQAVFSFENSHLYLPCSLYYNCNDTLESKVPPVKLHDICDGLLSNVIKLDEDEVCIKRRVEHIHLSQLITNSRWTNKRDAKYSDDLYEVQKLRIMQQNENIAAMMRKANQLFNQNAKYIKEFEIPCSKSNHYTQFSDICEIRASGHECALPGRHSICSYMICPGMFRCISLYCIHMSLVCDGQNDCIYGEDEASCTNPSCPGFLKCRGESRCISPDQICDGKVDCILAFDDEITCNYCPTFCRCDGYLLYCTADNITDVVTITRGPYSKGVILNGEQKIISIDMFSSLSLIFIDVAHCLIRQIHFTLRTHTFHQHIIFGNFSVNLLNDIAFFRAELLRKLVVVDISENLISVLSSNNLQLKYLSVIYAKHNPLLFIQIDKGMDFLELINLQNVEFRWRMICKINNFKLKIVVTDSILCCLCPNAINCIYDGGISKCYGIMKNMASSIAFIALSILAAATVLSVSIKILKMVFMNFKIRKYYNICILNHVVSSTCTTTCLICLSIIGFIDIHLISWRTSTGCHIINGFISVSVGTTMAFKAFSVYSLLS